MTTFQIKFNIAQLPGIPVLQWQTVYETEDNSDAINVYKECEDRLGKGKVALVRTTKEVVLGGAIDD